MSATKTQCDKVLRMLIDRWEGITPLDAMNEAGIMRLAARVADLRAEGHDIRSEMVKVRNRDGMVVRVARYRLVAS
jgi:hypothetical protein